MKKILVHAVMFAFLASAAAPFVSAQGATDAGEKDKSVEATIRQLNGQEVEALVQKDSKALARIWSDDLVVTNPLNKFVNKQDVLDMVQSGFLVITSYDRQIEYLHVYGATVIVAGSETVTWGGRMPNAGKTEHLRFTGIWMKQQGHWQEVARHANIVPLP